MNLHVARESGLSVAAHPFSPRPSVARAVGALSVLRFVPSLVTLVGLLLGVVGLLVGPSLAGLLALGAGLGCDVLDGQIARRLGLVTVFGGAFDATADTLLAGAMLAMLAVRMHPAWLLLVVPFAYVGALLHASPVYASGRRWRVSGRALATVAVMVVYAGAIE